MKGHSPLLPLFSPVRISKALLVICVYASFFPRVALGAGKCISARAVGGAISVVLPDDASTGIGISMLVQAACRHGPFRPELRLDHWQASLSARSAYRELSYWHLGGRWRAEFSRAAGVSYYASFGAGLERVSHRGGRMTEPAWRGVRIPVEMSKSDWGLGVGMGAGIEFPLGGGATGDAGFEFVLGMEVHLRFSFGARFRLAD